MKVSSVEEMRELDRAAAEHYGIPAGFLMENAGEAVYFVILSEYGVEDRRFVVLCGIGHNGGDGLVVARKINSSGGKVKVFLFGDPATFDAAPRLHLRMLERAGVPMAVCPSINEVKAALLDSDVVVDGLFGTGITREVGGRYRDAVEAIDASGKPVVAIDIPSGVDGNTGKIWGTAVRADITVTFGLPKRGNLLYPGAAQTGELYVSHISFPPELSNRDAIRVAINDPAPLPPRREDAHKGSLGDVLFIAGARGYFGAPGLAALSMLKAGGGYSRLATPRSVAPCVASYAPEIVFAPQDETAAGSLALAALDAVVKLSKQVDFVVLGPGLSLDGETQKLARLLATEIGKPLLIDGDGLTAIAADTDVIRRRAAPTVLTPHPGEMATLTERRISEIMTDPVTAVQRAAGDLGAAIVLKGAHSLIGLPDGRVFINTSGNAGMATAGSGDLLTGTIAAMHGLGLSIEDAVKTGVFLHGLAGDLAAGETGEDGVTARAILHSLPAAVAAYRKDFPFLTANACGAARIV